MQDNNLPSNWDHLNHRLAEVTAPENMPKKKSVFFWFFAGSLILFIIAAMYAGYTFYTQANNVSADKISLTLNIDESVSGGQEGQMMIGLQNNNKLMLVDAKLTIRTEKGFSRDGVIDQNVSIRELGNIVIGNYIATSSEYIFNGSEGDKRKVSITLEYKIPGSNTIYKKELMREVKIITPSVVINLSGMKDTIEDHEYLLKVNVKNVSYTSSVPLMLKIDVPSGFVVKRSSTSGETSFELNDFKVGSERDFEVAGYFRSSVSLSKTFNANVSTYEDGSVKSLISENIKEVALVRSPIILGTVIKANGAEEKNFVSSLDNQLFLDITNISPDYIAEMNVIMTTADRVFTFNRENTPDLLKVNPEEKKTVILLLGRDLPVGPVSFETEIYGKMRGDENTRLLRKTVLKFDVK